MTQLIKNRNNSVSSAGFTLFELVVVLAIISAMVAVVLPFCKRSNDGLKIRQHSSNIAQAIRYAIDLAEKNNRTTKFVFNDKRRSYYLQIEDSENKFTRLEDFIGTERFLDKNIYLFDIEGFEQAGPEYVLVFDPKRPWPDAWISLSIDDLTETIRIKSKYVQIKEDSI